MRSLLSISESLFYNQSSLRYPMEEQKYPGGCSSQNTINIVKKNDLILTPHMIFKKKKHLLPNDFICLYSYDAFVALGDNLTIEGVTLADDDQGRVLPNQIIPPKQYAWGGSTGVFKITATKSTYVNIYQNIKSYGLKNGSNHKVYLIMKENWSGTIKTTKNDNWTTIEYAAILRVQFIQYS